VCCNRRKVTNRIQSEIGIKEQIQHVEDSYESDEEEFTTGKVFPLSISRQTWDIMAPEPVRYGNESRRVLKKNVWAHVIADELVRQNKDTCTWKFFRNKVAAPKSDSTFCIFSGECKECGAEISGRLDKEPTSVDQDIIFQINIVGNSDVQHNQKRQLSGHKRQALKNDDSGRTSATVLRQHLASDIMEFGDCEPATIPSTAVIRQALHEERSKEKLSTNYYDGIIKVKSSISDFVRDFGRENFFVHFWSSKQIDIYRRMVQQRRDASLHIDATGNMVVPSPNSDGTNSKVFYYVGTMDGIPIFQMLSARHHTPAATFWMMCWIRDAQSLPGTVVIDNSIALIQACAIAFNGMSLTVLLDTYYKCLTDVSQKQVPKVWIRICCVHTVKLISQIKSFYGGNRHVKKFFMHAVCRLIESTSLHDAEKLFSSICMVALSETEGPACLEAYNFLSNRIALSEIGNDVEDLQLPERPVDSEESTSNKFTEIADTIIEEANSKLNSDRRMYKPNAFFVPDIPAEVKVTVFSKLPLTTAVVMQHYESNLKRISNSEVETHHGFLKNRVFADKLLPTSPDLFLLRFSKTLDGMMKLRAASLAYEQVITHEVSPPHPTQGGQESSLHSIQTTRISTTQDIPTSEVAPHSGQVPPTQRIQASQAPSTQPLHHNQVLPPQPVHTTQNSIQCTCAQCGLACSAAHQCSVCRKNVHLICGNPQGEEGYGQ
jgi:hypothetical protein